MERRPARGLSWPSAAGIGTLLLQRLIMESSSPLRVWAMGDSPAARALAAAAEWLPSASC